MLLDDTGNLSPSLWYYQGPTKAKALLSLGRRAGIFVAHGTFCCFRAHTGNVMILLQNSPRK